MRLEDCEIERMQDWKSMRLKDWKFVRETVSLCEFMVSIGSIIF